MASQIPDIYRAAIIRYEGITKKKLDDPSIAKLTTVDELTKVIDAENKDFGAFREKRHEVFKVLTVAMRPVELIGDVAAGGLSNVFPPSSMVFGAVAFLIKAAKNITAKYDAIVDLMETLKDFTIRLEIYNQEKISKFLSEKLAEILATLIDVLALSRKEIKDGRILNFTKHVIMRGDTKVQEAVAKLAKLTESEDRLVGAETLTEVKKVGGTLDTVSMTVTSTSVAVDQISGDMSKVSVGVSQLTQKIDAFMVVSEESATDSKEARGKTHQDHSRKVLQPSVSALDWYDKINKTRVPSTGDWIREESLFQSWLNREMPILWIAGNPGAGKSYIASNIISFLREQYPQGVHDTSNISVGYFFFRDDNPETRSFDQALRDMAYQISQNDPAYAKYIASTCAEAKDINSLQSVWRTLFRNYFTGANEANSNVYLLFDGIDESFVESRTQFLELTKDLRDASGARIHIVMLGRPHMIEEFEMVAEMTQVPTIYVTALNNSNDIVHYIESSIKKSAFLKRAPKTLQAEIVEKLSSGAQGMFIWVDFMLKELLKKRNEGAIRTALDSAPRGLDQMIRHVLEGFSLSLKDNIDAAEELNTLLAWVTCAPRPLTLEELDAVLKLESPTGDGNWWLEGTLRKQFASFFMLVREDGLTTADLQRARPAEDDFDVAPADDVPADGFDDVDNDTNFDSDPATTTVTFCHASIGDFFRNESETKAIAEEDCPAIGFEFHESEVSVLKTHLTVLCSEPYSEMWNRAGTLLALIRVNWMHALEMVEISRTGTEDKVLIGTALVDIFSHGQDAELLTSVAGYFRWNQFDQGNVNLVESWVTNTEVIDNLPTEDRNWIQSTAQNRAELFLPFAKWIGQQWLKGLYASTIHCPTNIYAYINLSKETPVWTMDTAEKIIEAAEWCEFEKNALWHRRLAMSLRDNGYYDAAVPHFRKARELDPSLWVARAGEAQCLYSKATTEAYEAAIGLDTITVNELDNMKPSKTLPLPTIMSNLHLCLERMGHCFLQLGKQEEELEAYRRAFTYENRCDTCLCALFRLYHSMRRHEDVMSLFKNLNEPIPDLDYTRLSESLLREGNYRSAYSFFDSVAIAAFKLHEIPFVAEMYRLAIAEARNQHKPVQATHLSLGLAELYDRYAHDPERAARIWEHVVDTYRSTKADTEIAEAKEAASSCLARTYLKRALDMGKDADESERCGAVLERLAKAKMGTRTSINASEATLTLGIWYKFMGRDDEARACFRVQIKEGIRMLSDDDPDNDWDAYWKLVCVLVAAGDDRNALVMLWKQFDVTCENDSKADEEAAAEQDAKAPDAEEEASEAQVQTDEDAQADPDTPTESTSMTCDGCLRGIAPDYCAICRYCFDVGFCPECFILLKNGTLPVNVCSPKHEWLVIEPRSEAERGVIRPDKLLVDGEQIGLDEWKKRLAKEWGV